jgi:hypothetical protein
MHNGPSVLFQHFVMMRILLQRAQFDRIISKWSSKMCNGIASASDSVKLVGLPVIQYVVPVGLPQQFSDARMFEIISTRRKEFGSKCMFDVGEAEYNCSQELAVRKAVPHLFEN